jgi:putative transposase
MAINRKKTQRLSREEGLTMRQRKGGRTAVGSPASVQVAAPPNQRGSLDFVDDQLASGRRFRGLSVVDDVTPEYLAAVPDTSISGKRAVRELTDLIAIRGKPGMIVSGNGTELTPNSLREWYGTGKIDWSYAVPAKPTHNAFFESFKGRMSDELLDETLFTRPDHALDKIAGWAWHYNTRRAPPRLATVLQRRTPMT